MTLTKADLAAALNEQVDLDRKVASYFVDAFF